MKVRNRNEVYKSSIDTGSESRVKKSQQASTDINNIVEKWLRQGAPAGGLWQNRRPPQYADFSNVNEYHEMLNQVRGAEADFEELPADVRARFGNKVENLIEWLANHENAEEALEEGITKPETEGRELAQTVEQNTSEVSTPTEESPTP